MTPNEEDRKAALEFTENCNDIVVTVDELAQFRALARAEERERCLRICEKIDRECEEWSSNEGQRAVHDIVGEIRALK